MARLVLLLALLLPGCGIAKSANDARLWLCDNVGEQERAAIQHQAELQGVSFDTIYMLWRAQCLIRLAAAEREAAGAIGTVKP